MVFLATKTALAATIFGIGVTFGALQYLARRGQENDGTGRNFNSSQSGFQFPISFPIPYKDPPPNLQLNFPKFPRLFGSPSNPDCNCKLIHDCSTFFGGSSQSFRFRRTCGFQGFQRKICCDEDPFFSTPPPTIALEEMKNTQAYLNTNCNHDASFHATKCNCDDHKHLFDEENISHDNEGSLPEGSIRSLAGGFSTETVTIQTPSSTVDELDEEELPSSSTSRTTTVETRRRLNFPDIKEYFRDDKDDFYDSTLPPSPTSDSSNNQSKNDKESEGKSTSESNATTPTTKTNGGENKSSKFPSLNEFFPDGEGSDPSRAFAFTTMSPSKDVSNEKSKENDISKEISEMTTINPTSLPTPDLQQEFPDTTESIIVGSRRGTQSPQSLQFEKDLVNNKAENASKPETTISTEISVENSISTLRHRSSSSRSRYEVSTTLTPLEGVTEITDSSLGTTSAINLETSPVSTSLDGISTSASESDASDEIKHTTENPADNELPQARIAPGPGRTIVSDHIAKSTETGKPDVQVVEKEETFESGMLNTGTASGAEDIMKSKEKEVSVVSTSEKSVTDESPTPTEGVTENHTIEDIDEVMFYKEPTSHPTTTQGSTSLESLELDDMSFSKLDEEARSNADGESSSVTESASETSMENSTTVSPSETNEEIQMGQSETPVETTTVNVMSIMDKSTENSLERVTEVGGNETTAGTLRIIEVSPTTPMDKVTIETSTGNSIVNESIITSTEGNVSSLISEELPETTTSNEGIDSTSTSSLIEEQKIINDPDAVAIELTTSSVTLVENFTDESVSASRNEEAVNKITTTMMTLVASDDEMDDKVIPPVMENPNKELDDDSQDEEENVTEVKGESTTFPTPSNEKEKVGESTTVKISESSTFSPTASSQGSESLIEEIVTTMDTPKEMEIRNEDVTPIPLVETNSTTSGMSEMITLPLEQTTANNVKEEGRSEKDNEVVSTTPSLSLHATEETTLSGNDVSTSPPFETTLSSVDSVNTSLSIADMDSINVETKTETSPVELQAKLKQSGNSPLSNAVLIETTTESQKPPTMDDETETSTITNPTLETTTHDIIFSNSDMEKTTMPPASLKLDKSDELVNGTDVTDKSFPENITTTSESPSFNIPETTILTLEENKMKPEMSLTEHSTSTEQSSVMSSTEESLAVSTVANADLGVTTDASPTNDTSASTESEPTTTTAATTTIALEGWSTTTEDTVINQDEINIPTSTPEAEKLKSISISDETTTAKTDTMNSSTENASLDIEITTEQVKAQEVQATTNIALLNDNLETTMASLSNDIDISTPSLEVISSLNSTTESAMSTKKEENEATEAHVPETTTESTMLASDDSNIMNLNESSTSEISPISEESRIENSTPSLEVVATTEAISSMNTTTESVMSTKDDEIEATTEAPIPESTTQSILAASDTSNISNLNESSTSEISQISEESRIEMSTLANEDQTTPFMDMETTTELELPQPRIAPSRIIIGDKLSAQSLMDLEPEVKMLNESESNNTSITTTPVSITEASENGNNSSTDVIPTTTYAPEMNTNENVLPVEATTQQEESYVKMTTENVDDAFTYNATENNFETVTDASNVEEMNGTTAVSTDVSNLDISASTNKEVLLDDMMMDIDSALLSAEETATAILNDTDTSTDEITTISIPSESTTFSSNETHASYGATTEYPDTIEVAIESDQTTPEDESISTTEISLDDSNDDGPVTEITKSIRREPDTDKTIVKLTHMTSTIRTKIRKVVNAVRSGSEATISEWTTESPSTTERGTMERELLGTTDAPQASTEIDIGLKTTEAPATVELDDEVGEQTTKGESTMLESSSTSNPAMEKDYDTTTQQITTEESSDELFFEEKPLNHANLTFERNESGESSEMGSTTMPNKNISTEIESSTVSDTIIVVFGKQENNNSNEESKATTSPIVDDFVPETTPIQVTDVDMLLLNTTERENLNDFIVETTSPENGSVVDVTQMSSDSNLSVEATTQQEEGYVEMTTENASDAFTNNETESRSETVTETSNVEEINGTTAITLLEGTEQNASNVLDLKIEITSESPKLSVSIHTTTVLPTTAMVTEDIDVKEVPTTEMPKTDSSSGSPKVELIVEVKNGTIASEEQATSTSVPMLDAKMVMRDDDDIMFIDDDKGMSTKAPEEEVIEGTTTTSSKPGEEEYSSSVFEEVYDAIFGASGRSARVNNLGDGGKTSTIVPTYVKTTTTPEPPFKIEVKVGPYDARSLFSSGPTAEEKRLEGEISNVVSQLLLTTHRNFHLLPSFVECAGARSRSGRRKTRVLHFDTENYPWMARVGFRESRGVLFPCAGTIISRRYILTSAHCATSKSNDSSVMEILLEGAKLAATGLTDQSEYKYKVDEVIVHQNYDNVTRENDLALIRLESEIPYFRGLSEVRPICLPFEDGYGVWDSLPGVGDTAYLGGWGYGLKNMAAKIEEMGEAAVEIWPNENCTYLYRGDQEKKITPQHICAYGKAEKDACRGDTGGPLMALMTRQKIFFQIGIVSYGPRCGYGVPAVYTRVSDYLSWILDSMRP